MRLFTVCPLLSFALLSPSILLAQTVQQKSRQSDESLEAFRVCARFEKTLADTLDFSAAYEQTFTRDPARRRALAIADDEFASHIASVDDATVIRAYKSRMQLIYLTLILAGPDTESQARLYFPETINNLMTEKPPSTREEFRLYTERLEIGAKEFRAHLDRLAANYPDVANRIKAFKAGVLDEKGSAITQEVKYVLGSRYDVDRVLKEADYYEIRGYKVVRESGEMRIVGIQLIYKLF
jgi:hypothetical protein